MSIVVVLPAPLGPRNPKTPSGDLEGDAPDRSDASEPPRQVVYVDHSHRNSSSGPLVGDILVVK
jgi:hypothetical protein